MPSCHCNPLVHSGGNQPTQHNSSEPVQGECYIGCNCASVLVLHVVLILVLYYVVVPTLVQYIWLHKLSCNSTYIQHRNVNVSHVDKRDCLILVSHIITMHFTVDSRQR